MCGVECMFEQCFKNIDNELRKDSGCSNDVDYIEQTSWILFLKYLDDLEKERYELCTLNGEEYKNILDKEFTWGVWAYPINKDGKLDTKFMTGDDLIEFVNIKLFPYLKSFRESASSADTLEYKIGEIFSEIQNSIKSGYILRDVINIINGMKFQTSEERHELSYFYEDKIMKMGNSGRAGGEYYTPRPLIRTIIKVIKPKIGEKIYDGACGSAGFLVEAYDYLNKLEVNMSEGEKYNILQKKTLYGQEFKPLPYVIGIMNMILHGINAPNIVHKDTLSENIMTSVGNKYEVILANPPFGAATQDSVLSNFPIRTKETAYLFLQHFKKMLKKGGRAGIVVKNTFLSNSDASILRKEFLEDCNLFAVLDLPSKVFQAGVKTVVLFFEKGKPAKNIWYYQLNLNRNLGKTNPLNEKDLEDFVNCFEDRRVGENSWIVNIEDIDKNSYDLSVKNPNRNEESILEEPEDIIDNILGIEEENKNILQELKGIL